MVVLALIDGASSTIVLTFNPKCLCKLTTVYQSRAITINSHYYYYPTIFSPIFSPITNTIFIPNL